MPEYEYSSVWHPAQQLELEAYCAPHSGVHEEFQKRLHEQPQEKHVFPNRLQ